MVAAEQVSERYPQILEKVKEQVAKDPSHLIQQVYSTTDFSQRVFGFKPLMGHPSQHQMGLSVFAYRFGGYALGVAVRELVGGHPAEGVESRYLEGLADLLRQISTDEGLVACARKVTSHSLKKSEKYPVFTLIDADVWADSIEQLERHNVEDFTRKYGKDLRLGQEVLHTLMNEVLIFHTDLGYYIAILEAYRAAPISASLKSVVNAPKG